MTIDQSERPASAEAGVRVDPDSGITEIIEFFGPAGEQIFGCRSLPAQPASGGLVVCSSLHAEHLNGYRSEVELARRLAGQGIAVQRFHYRGSGHSDAASADANFEMMIEDALRASERLCSETGLAKAGFLGLRWGTLVAAAAASRSKAAPVVLWEPVDSAERFFRDAFRAAMVRDVNVERTAPRPAEERVRDNESLGSVEIMGYPIDRALYSSAQGRTLVGELGDARGPILLAQIGRRRQLRKTYEELVEHLRSRGLEVEIAFVEQDEISWFLPTVRKRPEVGHRLIETTTDWLLPRMLR